MMSDDEFSRPERRAARPDVNDLAHNFVAEYERSLQLLPKVANQVNVCPADSGRPYSKKHLVRARGWLRNID
jgi:hypothetical protein